MGRMETQEDIILSATNNLFSVGEDSSTLCAYYTGSSQAGVLSEIFRILKHYLE